jgi:hypothetical protein
MSIQQRAIIGVLVIAGFVFFSNKSTKGLTNDEVQNIINTVNESFDKAEKKVFGDEPDEPDVPSGPDPDPDKCICQGTGKIVQGDGHITPCPYHSGQPLNEGEIPSLEEETKPPTYRVIPRKRIFGNLFRWFFIN